MGFLSFVPIIPEPVQEYLLDEAKKRMLKRILIGLAGLTLFFIFWKKRRG